MSHLASLPVFTVEERKACIHHRFFNTVTRSRGGYGDERDTTPKAETKNLDATGLKGAVKWMNQSAQEGKAKLTIVRARGMGGGCSCVTRAIVLRRFS
jgi:hypothetical protein